MEDVVGRGTAMMLQLNHYNVSMRLADDFMEAAVEAAVRKAMNDTKQVLPETKGQLYDVSKGFPLVKKSPSTAKLAEQQAAEVSATQQQTLAEIREGKQAVLAPLPDAPGATVTETKKRKKEKEAAAKAAEKEKQAQEQASKRAKATRDKDVASAKVGASSKSPRKSAGLAPPKKTKPTTPPDGSGDDGAAGAPLAGE